ncbi:hypothetical protein GGU11DRAFT_746632 [Lentinula aff. detonsa]|nr:hypothetical protein GGU11DRAFT_746632 [Lentinula aff. detonsa]
MPPIAQKAASSPLNFGRIAKPLRGGGGAANSTSTPPSISGGSNSSSPLGRLQNEESGNLTDLFFHPYTGLEQSVPHGSTPWKANTRCYTGTIAAYGYIGEFQ